VDTGQPLTLETTPFPLSRPGGLTLGSVSNFYSAYYCVLLSLFAVRMQVFEI